MAPSNKQPIRHFLDPHHLLEQTQYSPNEAGLCNICLLKLAGLRPTPTYGCYACNIHLHSACAHHFQETTSFFAHPEHPLKLRRSPGRICDICRGDCPPKSFVYSCIGCGFDVHPLCSMLPEMAACPWDPSHQLCMFSSESPGSCSACRDPLPRWHYIGSSSKLHIECAAGQGSNGHAATQIQSSYGAAVVQGSSHGGAVSRQRSLGAQHAGYNQGFQQGYGHPYYAHPPPIQGAVAGYGPHTPPIHGIVYYVPVVPASTSSSGSGQQSFFNRSNLMIGIAKFLAGTAISLVAGPLISELLQSVTLN